MDSNTTYTKTARGLRALVKKLPEHAGLALSVIDKGQTTEELLHRLPAINEKDFEFAIKWLLEGGFIKALVSDPFPNSMWNETKSAPMVVAEIGIDQFTVSEKPASAPVKKAKFEDEKKRLEEADKEAQERAEAALAKMAGEAGQSNHEMAHADKEAEEEARLAAARAEEEAEEARALLEAEEKAKLEAEEEARLAAARAEEEAEEARALLEAEEKAKLEAEEEARLAAARAEEEAEEARALLEAEEKAKLEAEEEARLAAARAEEEAEEARIQLEAKEKARLNAAKEKAAVKEATKREAAAKKEEKAKRKEEKKAAAKAAAEQKATERAAAKEQALLEAAVVAEKKAAEKQKRSESQYRVKPFTRIKQWLTSILKSIKPLSIYALGVLLLLIIATQFINFHIWINPIEKLVSSKVKDDININAVRISLFPSPHLVLEGLKVSDSTTIKAEKVHIYPSISNLKEKLLRSAQRPYEAKFVSIEGFNIAQKDLSRLASWANEFSNDKQLSVNKITLKSMSISLNSIELPNFNGELLLNNAGKLKEATITTSNKNVSITFNQFDNKYLIDVVATQWRAPITPYPIFKKLNASGTIDEKILSFSKITGDLYKGHLTAKLSMDFASTKLASQGELKLSDFLIADMAEELKLDTYLDGKLNTNGKYSFNVNKASNSIENTKLNAVFDIKNGSLKKVDLIEAMRSGNLSGSTHFTKLSGFTSLNNNTYQFTNLQLKDSQLQASGRLSISSDKQASAIVSTRIAVNQNEIKSRLHIKGPLTTLKLEK